jgi:hypothetical protein
MKILASLQKKRFCSAYTEYTRNYRNFCNNRRNKKMCETFHYEKLKKRKEKIKSQQSTISRFACVPLGANFIIYFPAQVKAKYMDTGSYLRPHDILYCLEKTKFNEDSIISWFKRYTLQLA